MGSRRGSPGGEGSGDGGGAVVVVSTVGMVKVEVVVLGSPKRVTSPGVSLAPMNQSKCDLIGSPAASVSICTLRSRSRGDSPERTVWIAAFSRAWSHGTWTQRTLEFSGWSLSQASFPSSSSSSSAPDCKGFNSSGQTTGLTRTTGWTP